MRLVTARPGHGTDVDLRGRCCGGWFPGSSTGLGAIALVAVPSLFGVPLESIRIFYPDVGWGLTAIGVLAILWGLARTALALRSIVSAA